MQGFPETPITHVGFVDSRELVFSFEDGRVKVIADSECCDRNEFLYMEVPYMVGAQLLKIEEGPRSCLESHGGNCVQKFPVTITYAFGDRVQTWEIVRKNTSNGYYSGRLYIDVT